MDSKYGNSPAVFGSAVPPLSDAEIAVAQQDLLSWLQQDDRLLQGFRQGAKGAHSSPSGHSGSSSPPFNSEDLSEWLEKASSEELPAELQQIDLFPHPVKASTSPAYSDLYIPDDDFMKEEIRQQQQQQQLQFQKQQEVQERKKQFEEQKLIEKQKTLLLEQQSLLLEQQHQLLQQHLKDLQQNEQVVVEPSESPSHLPFVSGELCFTPERSAASPELSYLSSESAAVSPQYFQTYSEPSVMQQDYSVGSSENTVVSHDGLIISPENIVISQDYPVVSPEASVLSQDFQVVSPENPVSSQQYSGLSPTPTFILPENTVVEDDNCIILSDNDVEFKEEEIVTTEPSTPYIVPVSISEVLPVPKPTRKIIKISSIQKINNRKRTGPYPVILPRIHVSTPKENIVVNLKKVQVPAKPKVSAPQPTLKEALARSDADELISELLSGSYESSPSTSQISETQSPKSFVCSSPYSNASDFYDSSDDVEEEPTKSSRYAPYKSMERKLRKKEQNKRAALRYRQKKKEEEDQVLAELKEEERIERELTAKYEALQMEMKLMRKLLKEMLIAKMKK